MRAPRVRIDDPEPRASLWVAYPLTRTEWARLLFHTPQWRPGSSPRIGQWHAANTMRTDPDTPSRPVPTGDARYMAALREVERWRLFSPAATVEAQAR